MKQRSGSLNFEQSPYHGIEDNEDRWPAVIHRKSGDVEILSAFSPAEFEGRLLATRAKMAEGKFDVLLLTAPESIFYLTGFETPGNPFTCLVVPFNATQPPHLVTRELEGSNAKYRSAVEYTAYGEGEEGEKVLADYVTSLGSEAITIGYEAKSSRLTVHSQHLLEAYLEGVTPVHWVDAAHVVLELRSIKSPQELVYSRRAAQFVIEGLRAAVSVLRLGVPETTLAGKLLRAAGREVVGA